jgi:hypothetical protein
VSAIVCLTVSWMAAGVIHGAGQDAKSGAPSVWDGVYTAEQAMRGRTAYMQSCAGCHADDLRGRSTAPSLVEESFAFLWGDMPVGDLLDRIQKVMPPDRPGSLPAQTYRDIVAFVLESNGFPSGSKELDSDLDALRRITIKMKRP